MLIEEGSRPYLYIEITGPAGWTPEGTTAEIALVPEDKAVTEDDWHDANWDGTQARIMVAYSGAGGGTGCPEFGAGEYVAKARLTKDLERVVITSGRVRVGAGS